MSFLPYRLIEKYTLHFSILRFIAQNILALLKDRSLKWTLLKKEHRLVVYRLKLFISTIGSNNSFTLIENDSRFLRSQSSRLQFNMPMTKCTQLWKEISNYVKIVRGHLQCSLYNRPLFLLQESNKDHTAGDILSVFFFYKRGTKYNNTPHS